MAGKIVRSPGGSIQLMQNSARSLLKIFKILPGEERVVGLLLGQAFLIGLTRLFHEMAATTLFLAEFNASQLPYVYITVAAIIPVTGWINTRLQSRINFARILLYSLAVYWLLLGGLWVGISLTSSKWAVFASLVWTEVGWVATNLVLWGLASRMLNVRQGKRLFGLIGAGGGVASILGGLMTPILAGWFGVTNLLMIPLGTIALAMVLLVYIARAYPKQVAEEVAEQEETTDIPAQNLRAYIPLIMVVAMISVACFYFIDNIFFRLVEVQYPDEIGMASFLGVYMAVLQFTTLLSGLFLVSWMIGRFGVRAGLLITPLITWIIAVIFAVSGWAIVPFSFLLFLATLNSIVDWTLRDTVFYSSILILHQPLPPSTRSRTQTQMESIAMPIAQGIAGLVLAGMGVVSATALQINWILILLLAGCVVLSYQLGKAYLPVLIEALSRRALKLSESSLVLNDPSSRAILLRELMSPYPEAAIYALNTLVAMDYPLDQEYPALLEHPATTVRREVLKFIEQLKPEGVQDLVHRLLTKEEDPIVRAAGLRALFALTSGQLAEEMESHLNSTDPALMVVAMVTLMNQGRVELEAQLRDLLSSDNPIERRAGLQIISELEQGDRFSNLILTGLKDENMDVRREAMWIAVEMERDELSDAVFSSMNDAHARMIPVEALISKGDRALPLVRQRLLDPSASRAERIGCLRVLARLRNPESIEDILTQLESRDFEIRNQALIALQRCGYRFEAPNPNQFKLALIFEISDAVQTAALQLELDSLGWPILLQNALDFTWRQHKERVFLLLRMLYDSALVLRLRDNLLLDSLEKHAYALEVIDHMLEEEYKPLIMPMLEDIPTTQRLEQWSRRFDILGITELDGTEALLEMPVDYSSGSRTPWMKSCVIQAYAENEEFKFKIYGMSAKNELVRNTLAWATGKKEENMLSVIERVLILKTVSIFKSTPDHLLAEVADLLEEEHLPADQTFIVKDDPASCLYVIVEGAVRIHDGERVFSKLGPRDIVGEMAVLESAPRSASVTTVEATHLLKLDSTPLFELLADRPEVAQGIIQVLAGRLRAMQQ